jgi:hypothetical protein
MSKISKVETIYEFTNEDRVNGVYRVTISGRERILIRNNDSVAVVSHYLDKPATQCVDIIRDDVKEELFEFLKSPSGNEQRMYVSTPLGTLVIYENGFGDEYPGVSIDLRRPDSDHEVPLALIEHTTTESDYSGEGKIITRVWRDVNQEDCSDRVVHEGFDEFFSLESGNEKAE